MVLNDPSLREGGTLLNGQPADKAGDSAGHRDRDEPSGDTAPSGPMGKNTKISSRQKTSRISSSSLNWSQDPSLLSPSGYDQSHLHRRNNRNRKAGSQGGKENIPPHLRSQPGKTYNTKARRPVLADVTTAHQRASESFDQVSFAGSTSIHSPSRKVGNGEPGAAGLRFELDPQPSFAESDSQETITAQDSLFPIAIESLDRLSRSRTESAPPSPSTPLRDALASLNDMFSSTFTFPSKKSTTGNDPSNPFRLSFHLPAPPLPTGVSISNAFNMSTLADSISQLTGDIAASITAGYTKNDHLYQGQYHEDAVARDERFDWEEEMRCLEIHCGSYGETK